METTVHSAYFSKDIQKRSTHYHDCHQIVFILDGTIGIYVNQTKYIATAGNIAIFNRYENHSIDVVSDKYERFVLRISPIMESKHKEYSVFLNRPAGFNNILDVSETKDEFEYVFKKIVSEGKNKNPMAEEMQQLLIRQLLIMIYRRNPENFSPFDEEKFDIIFEIQKQFESNCKIAYSLNELAKQYHISASTLSHQFKRITGFSVFEYLYSCRIASAKYYLTKTDLSIAEIVEECGFGDNSNFSRTFKKRTGMTPSKFRSYYT